MKKGTKILAFDSANESISVALGDILHDKFTYLAGVEIKAHRASNQMLLPEIEKLFAKSKVKKDEIITICAGRGPGSFTGVRIALATAKGIASALELPLIGFNTLEAIA